MCKYHGAQLYFYFAVYIAVALLFAFTSCCVSGRTGVSLDQLVLVSRCLKSLCQLAREKNKNRKLKRLVTMKTDIFQFAPFAVCQSVKDYPVLLIVKRESRYQTVCGNFLPQIYPFTQILIAVELSVLVITTSH